MSLHKTKGEWFGMSLQNIVQDRLSKKENE